MDSDGIDLLNEPKSSDVYQENWENVVLLFPIVSPIDPVFLEKEKKNNFDFVPAQVVLIFIVWF